MYLYTFMAYKSRLFRTVEASYGAVVARNDDEARQKAEQEHVRHYKEKPTEVYVSRIPTNGTLKFTTSEDKYIAVLS